MPASPKRSPTESPAPARVVPLLASNASDQALVEAVLRGQAGASTLLYDRYAEHVRRVIGRVLGPDPELGDLLHDVFLQIFQGLERLEDADRLEAWLTRIAVNTARTWIRRRRRRRWLRFLDPGELPEVRVRDTSDETRDAMHRTYAVLQKLPADERIPFALRFLAEMELTEVADACDVSLATIKRRLRKARRRFEALAARDPVLRGWLEGGAS